MKLFGNDLTFNGGKIFHEGQMPTPQDINSYARHGTVIERGSDMNDYLEPGCYEVKVGNPSNNSWDAYNTPNHLGVWPWGLLVVHAAQETEERRYVQIYYPYKDNQAPVRRMTNKGSWLPWRKEGHGTTLSDLGAAASNHTHTQVNSRGQNRAESGTELPPLSGISMAESYRNGYPADFGNALTLKGRGSSQLFIGWSGTSGAHAPVYVRSKRDDSNANWSDWAKIYTSAMKPTPSEIGAAASGHTHADITTRTISDWNNAGGNGFLQAENAQNAPNNDTGWYWGFKMQHRVGYGAQILVKNQSPRMFFRAQTTDGSGEWNEVYHTNNKPTPQDIGAATEDHTHDNITTLQAHIEELQERNKILEEGLNLLAEGNVEQLRAILKSV